MFGKAGIALILLGIIAAGAYYASRSISPEIGKVSDTNNNMKISLESFSEGRAIPSKFTCDGEDKSPKIIISGVPSSAKSLALIMDDPDAPRGTFVHWIMWNIPITVGSIEENSVPEGAAQGSGSSGKVGYIGPCPPSGTHRYFFKLYALDSLTDIPEGSNVVALIKSMDGHILEEAQTFGTYSRIK